MALIKCENVSIGYEGQMVVHDLNFEINQGDYLCIVGENGSGKSTLVKSLLGLKNVDKGKIVFDDGLKQTEIGYLPQQTDVKKDFPASVYEVVLSGRLNSRGMKPFYTAEDKKCFISARARKKKREFISSWIWLGLTVRILIVSRMNFPVDKDSVFCLQEHCVRQRNSCFLMNLSQDWIQL